MMYIQIIRGWKGWVGACVASIIPMMLWWWHVSPVRTFSVAMNYIGRASALLGMAMLSVAMILSARLRWFDRMFYGIGNAYIAHHWFGIGGFLLVLFHPLFLASAVIGSSPRSAALLFLPTGENLARTFGIFSLFLLIVLLGITFFARFRYQTKKFFHRILGAAFIFGGLHMLMIPSDVARVPLLRWYMSTFFVLGLVAYGYRTLLGWKFSKSYPYLVTKVRRMGDTMTEIVLSPLAYRMQYDAGQFVFMRVFTTQISREQHPFSLTSSPSGENISLLVKSLGDYTQKIQSLREGSIAKLEGPYGTFVYYHGIIGRHRSQIWIAGGSGIAPFLGVARDVRHRYSKGRKTLRYDITLYYVVRSQREGSSVAEELCKISSCVDGFRVFPYFTEKEKRFFTVEDIHIPYEKLVASAVLICGPPAMVQSLYSKLLVAGVPSWNIYIESFALL